MSTGLECDFVETTDGKHYLLLERRSGPPEDYEDLGGHEVEDYDAYGPFGTFELAHAWLRDNFSNPGGFSRQRLEGPPAEWMAEKIASAETPARRRW